MISVSGKNWEELRFNKRLVEKVKIDNDFSEILSKLIISRGFSETEIFTIKNELNFPNPFLKNYDFLSACEILKKSIKKNDKILIFGDYDVDGCVSTSLLVNFLNIISVKSDYFIPDRINDGYGANIKTISILVKEKKPQLVIFLDNGSSSYETIEFLNDLNIKTIIIDHHNINKPYPKANVIINPKKKKEYEDYDYLCSAFLTYLFLDTYIQLNKLNISLKKKLIYVLLATVTDVMPLRGINRLLSKNILPKFDINNDYIIKHIFKLNRINKRLDIEELGFSLGPLFNSAGRISNANQIVDLLTTNTEFKKKKILNKITKINERRKKIEKYHFDKIDLNKLSKEKGIIYFYDSDIPEGIIGILASKIKDYFNKPCIVFTKSGKKIKGSARSTFRFNIGEYIQGAIKENIIVSGGGHNLAAGLVISKSKLNDLKSFLNNIYNKSYIKQKNIYLSKLSLNAVNKDFLDNLNLLGPFGHMNQNPFFLIQDLRIINPVIIKDKFITCYLKSKNKMVKAISYNPINSKISLNLINNKMNIDIISSLKLNNWKNKTSIQLEIIDVLVQTNNT